MPLSVFSLQGFPGRSGLFRLTARILVFASFVLLVSTGRAETVVLTETKPLEILLPSEATPAEEYAAEELALHLKKILGQTVPVSKSAEAAQGRFPLVVGRHPLNLPLEPQTLREEESVVSITPNAIHLVGGRTPEGESEKFGMHDRGTLYAVYDFLEGIGVRWYRPEPWGEYVPRLQRIELPVGRTRTNPTFKYRYGIAHYNTWGRTPEWHEKHLMAKIWAVRNRQNTNLWRGQDLLKPEVARFGGVYEVDFAHAYFRLIPHDEYFPAHPEYFALINGRRSTNPQAQLCLGNPDLQEEVLKKLRLWGKNRPHQEILSLDPNDTELWCECDLCTAMDNPAKLAPYGKGAGGVSMSDRVLKFNSLIAQKLEKERPGIKIGSYAYWQYTEPPSEDVTVAPNVVVQPAAFAGTYSDYSRKLYDPESVQNTNFRKVMEGYARRNIRLFSREYWSCYIWPGPMPVVSTMVDRLRNYHSRFQVEGVYSQTHPCWGPQGMILYFYTWLLRNPHADVEQEKERYYSNFYGPAAGPMRSYHEKLEQIAQEGTYFGSGGSRMDELFTEDLMQELDGHLAKAEDLVGDQAPYRERLDGIVAGQAFTTKALKFRSLVAQGKPDAALKELRNLETFYYSFSDGSVFDVAATTDGKPFRPGIFRNYRRLADEKGGRILELFEDPRTTQIHTIGWRFSPDPERKGRENGWDTAEFDDSSWVKVDAGKSWQQQGFQGLSGEAWYRRSFTPPEQDGEGRLIVFLDAIRGDAEVFLNGKSILQHRADTAAAHTDEPVFVDVTDLVVPRKKNQLTIAISDHGKSSGLTRPVLLLSVKSIIPPA